MPLNLIDDIGVFKKREDFPLDKKTGLIDDMGIFKERKVIAGLPFEGVDVVSGAAVSFSKWNQVEESLPKDTLLRNKARNAVSLAATLDIPPSQAYELHDELAKGLHITDASFGQKAWTNFTKAGVGNTYVNIGRTLQWLGNKEMARDYIEYGEKLQLAYIPPENPEEFTFKKMLDPDWWATSVASNIPFTLALIPAAVVGAYAGAGTATAIGLGTFGRLILGSIGGALFSRPIESAMEAGGVYEQALEKGLSEEDANEAAGNTFKDNMALVGLDATQFAAAFVPLKFLGKAASKTLIKRILATTGKVGVVGAMELGEETYQDIIKRKALGEEIAFDPQMKESAAIGAVFGIGLGGAGSVWTSLTGRVKNEMSEELLKQYEDTKNAEIAMGATEQEAEIRALDAIAETPEGQKIVEQTIQKMKNIVEGKEEIIAPEEQEKRIEETAEKVAKEAEEFMSDEDIDAIARGEKTIEDFMLVKEEVIEVAPIEAVKPAEVPEVTPKRIISEEAYQKAKNSFESKSKELKAGVDPTMMANLVTMGAYHIETGIRTFAEWSKVMVKEFGERVKPYLKNIWKDANAYLEQKIPMRETKKLIRRTTGQVNIARLIAEDETLYFAMKKAQESARIAYKVGTREALERAKSEMRDIVLKAKIKAEIQGVKTGFAWGTKITKQDLIAAFKDSQKQNREAQQLLRNYIEDNLPPELRGKFLTAMSQKLTRKQLAKTFGRVEAEAERFTRKELKAEAEELLDLKGNIALDYQRKIQELLGDIELKKISDKTIKRLEGLKDYIEKHGVPSGISKEKLDALKRLERIKASDMSVEELQTLVDTAQHLKQLGKLKQELKYKYNEHLRRKAKEKLIASTKSFDAENKSLAYVKQFYMDTLQTIRVAEIMDNYKKGGENAKLVKRLIIKETNALLQTRTLFTSAIEEIHALGMEEIPENRQVAMMINIRNMEGAFEQVKTLMVQHGYTEIPTLTEQENRAIEIIEKYVTQNTNTIAAIFEEIKNEPFVKLPRYILPLLYEKEFSISPDDLIQQRRHRTTQTFQGFTFERQEGVKKTPRTDIFGIFEQAINSQQYYINMQPELENIRYLVLSKEYHEAAGDLNTNWWRDHLDMVARRGWSATAGADWWNAIFREARFNITTAILGYKLSSILMQPFALVDAMAYAQVNWGTIAGLEILAEFSKAWVNPKAAMEFIETSPALTVRRAGETAIAETLEKIGQTKGLWQSYLRGGLSLLQKADILTAAGVERGILNVLEKHGVPNAKEEADILMSMVSSSSEVTFRPHIINRGEISRMVFTFQTFFLNRWGIIAHDLIMSGLIKSPAWKTKVSALVGLMIFMAGKIAEDEAREFIYETVTRRKMPDVSPIVTALTTIPGAIPYFGNIIEAVVQKRGLSSEAPLVRAVGNGFRGLTALASGDWEKMKKGGVKVAETILTVYYGVPGTAQFFDLMEGIFAQEKKPKVVKKATKIKRE